MAISLGTALFLSTVAGVGAGIVSGNNARDAANNAQAYNNQIAALQSRYRLEVLSYNNTVYAQDVDFYRRNIAYQRDEHDRMKVRVGEQVAAVNENMFGRLATQMTKMVEQDIAETLSALDVGRQVKQETGVVNAAVADAGVTGNTVDLLRGEVQRQGGEAINSVRMNAQVQRRQAGLEMQSIKAGRDAALSGLTIPTFAPIAPPSAPAPVSPINPAQPVARPSTASIVLNAAATGINLGIAGGTLHGMFSGSR